MKNNFQILLKTGRKYFSADEMFHISLAYRNSDFNIEMKAKIINIVLNTYNVNAENLWFSISSIKTNIEIFLCEEAYPDPHLHWF